MLFTDVLRVQIKAEKIFSDINMLNNKYWTFSEDNFECKYLKQIWDFYRIYIIINSS